MTFATFGRGTAPGILVSGLAAAPDGVPPAATKVDVLRAFGLGRRSFDHQRLTCHWVRQCDGRLACYWEPDIVTSAELIATARAE
jgi:hypothetical protein